MKKKKKKTIASEFPDIVFCYIFTLKSISLNTLQKQNMHRKYIIELESD